MPGVTIIERDAPPSLGAPTDTGQAFVAILTQKGGANGPELVRSLQEAVQKLGTRQTYSVGYDWLETFFREGGSRAYVSRILGPAAAKASVALLDGSAGTVFTVRAESAGEWGNALNVAVLAGDAPDAYKIQVSHDTDGVLETSPDLVDKAAGLAWSEQATYVELVSGASTNDPATVAATSLAGGVDDRAAVTDAQRTTALAAFSAELGPGQVVMPDSSSTTMHAALLAHAAAHRRVAVLDAADTASNATLKAASVALRSDTNAKRGSLWAPWLSIPGLVTGTTRSVPPSAAVCGLIARNDGQGVSVNQPAAGLRYGVTRFVRAARAAFIEAQLDDLNSSGVNMLKDVRGSVVAYGDRTLVDPVKVPLWREFSDARLHMLITAEANAIAERFVFRQIDGRGLLFSELNGELTGMLLGHYNDGALYGDTPDDAFTVDTGSAVNTPATIAAGEIRAAIGVRMSPTGEEVVIEITKLAVSE